MTFAIILALLAVTLLIAAGAMVAETFDDIPDDPHEAAAAWDEWHAEKETR